MENLIDIETHPAVKALRKILPDFGMPTEIEVLKRKWKKSEVYRLQGPHQSIIAKGVKFSKIQTELFIYQEILPHCDFPSLKYYGFEKNEEPELSWLFLEDAGEVVYDKSNAQHRKVIMEWLGALHSMPLSTEIISLLPNKSLQYHYENLHRAISTLATNLNDPKLNEEQIEVHRKSLFYMNQINSKWSQIQATFAEMPQTWCHGDFKSGNIRMVARGKGVVPAPFDWEFSGWGVGAVDLGGVVYPALLEDVRIYYNLIRGLSPGLNYEKIEGSINPGRILRLIDCVYWSSFHGVENLVRYNKSYHLRLSLVFDELKW